MNPQTHAKQLVFPSQLGWMGMIISSDELARTQIEYLTFGHPTAELAEQAVAHGSLTKSVLARQRLELDHNTDPELRDWIGRLQEFASGRFADLGVLRLNLGYLSNFGRQVIEACRNVSWGETASYGELARRVGSPAASRAVGGVMARNRHPLVVPCHRIIASNGALVGFSAPEGTQMKKRLLHNERSRD
jgi:O-6-methylguanine DNA methyltransferase